MPFKTRLSIINKSSGIETDSFNINNISNNMSIAAQTSDYKIVEGNREKGIIQGIGLIKSGRKNTYEIPIFENGENKDIYALIARYTALLQNSFTFRFFIEHEIEKETYKAEVIITDISGYKVERTNYIKSFTFSAVMIDNYYKGELIEEKIDVSGSGSKEFTVVSQSLVPSNILFSCVFNKQDSGTFTFWLSHKENFGVSVSLYLENGKYKIDFDGDSVYISKEENGAFKDGMYIEAEGVTPFMEAGENIFTVNSNATSTEFIIKYYKGCAL